jgi:predicted nucleic acid-binding protein
MNDNFAPVLNDHILQAAEEGAPALPTVYLDTSVPSYLTARPARDRHAARMQRVSCLWWNAYRSRFSVFVSEVVLIEATIGNEEAASRRTESISAFTSLGLTAEAKSLAKLILIETRLPERILPDAQHAAIAATNDIDVLMTWNSRHLANPEMIPKVRRVCEQAGFNCPDICKPDNVIRRYIYGRNN